MTTQYKQPIGILGGTFDPIHSGHLKIAELVLKNLKLASIRFIPCYIPVHRPTPIASIEQRIAMLQLALKNHPDFQLDLREVERKKPSYMIETLISLHDEFPTTPLCLIIGVDSFLQLSSWHRWKELLQYANIIVMNRCSAQDYNMPFEILEKLNLHQTTNPDDLAHYLNGKIYQFHIAPINISATQIRNHIQQGLKIDDLIPQDVLHYIVENKIYQ